MFFGPRNLAVVPVLCIALAASSESLQESGRAICSKCGQEMKEGQLSCTKCVFEITPETRKLTLKQALLLPGQVGTLPARTAAVCLQAVAYATAKAGGGKRIVTTGTIVEKDAIKRQYEYSDEPADRLRVEFAAGSVIEFTVEALEGDFGGDLFNFFRRPHDFRVTAATPGVGKVKYAYSRTKTGYYTTDRAVTMKGKARIEGIDWTVDLKTTGTSYSEADGKGGEFREDDIVEGTIRSAGYAAEVKERHQLHSVFSQGQEPASTSSRVMDDRWTIDGVEYRLTGTIQRHLIKAVPVDVETNWTGKGRMLKDGKKHGVLRLVYDKNDRKVQVVLEVEGEKIVLESWGGR